jgi:hypothetical protein
MIGPSTWCAGSLSVLLLAVTACSESGSTQSALSTSVSAVVASELPIVDEIRDAIAVLEDKLGGPQEYFEINATARLVNLFVALNDGAVVQPWVYIAGELSSDEGQSAEGGTLRAVDLDFDPQTILARLHDELPGATVESFYVHGDGTGAVQYGALVTTAQGGALDVQLAADGAILSATDLD